MKLSKQDMELSKQDMEQLRRAYFEFEHWNDIALDQTPEAVSNYIEVLEERLYKLTQDAWGQ